MLRKGDYIVNKSFNNNNNFEMSTGHLGGACCVLDNKKSTPT